MAEALIDMYGFPTKANPAQLAERAQCDANVTLAQNAWAPYVKSGQLPPEPKLKDMIRKGVPPPLRSWVWMETSGANAKKARAAGSYYQIMLKASERSLFIKEVETDSKHTFPGHTWLNSEDGQAALQRVLLAYSMHNDRVGYCRSMNNIVAMLLVALNRNEESAFWLLATLVEDILHPGTYARNLEGCQVEMKALDELISTKLPRLQAHFRSMELDISIIATDWYLCLFCTSLPSETVARVWDALFAEGPKILYRTALALMKIYEENILKVDNAGELMMRLRSAVASMHQRDALMSTAFDGIGGLPMAVIDKWRDVKTKEVEEHMERRRLGGSMSGTPGMEHDAHLPGSSHGGGDVASTKLKAGFGAFMGGLTKLADRTVQITNELADKTGKLTNELVDKTTDSLAKLKTKDREEEVAEAAVAEFAADQGGSAIGGSAMRPPPAAPRPGGGGGGSGGGSGGSSFAAAVAAVPPPVSSAAAPPPPPQASVGPATGGFGEDAFVFESAPARGANTQTAAAVKPASGGNPFADDDDDEVDGGAARQRYVPVGSHVPDSERF